MGVPGLLAPMGVPPGGSGVPPGCPQLHGCPSWVPAGGSAHPDGCPRGVGVTEGSSLTASRPRCSSGCWGCSPNPAPGGAQLTTQHAPRLPWVLCSPSTPRAPLAPRRVWVCALCSGTHRCASGHSERVPARPCVRAIPQHPAPSPRGWEVPGSCSPGQQDSTPLGSRSLLPRSLFSRALFSRCFRADPLPGTGDTGHCPPPRRAPRESQLLGGAVGHPRGR